MKEPKWINFCPTLYISHGMGYRLVTDESNIGYIWVQDGSHLGHRIGYTWITYESQVMLCQVHTLIKTIRDKMRMWVRRIHLSHLTRSQSVLISFCTSNVWFTSSSRVFVETFEKLWMRRGMHECRHSHSCARIMRQVQLSKVMRQSRANKKIFPP